MSTSTSPMANGTPKGDIRGESSIPTERLPPARKKSAVNPLFKTTFCKYWAQGKCLMPDTCRFAHTFEEVRERPMLTKTKLCEMYMKGSCSADDCEFAHGTSDLRATPQFYKTSICAVWKLGRCTLGDECRHAHGASDLLPSLPMSATPRGSVSDALTRTSSSRSGGSVLSREVDDWRQHRRATDASNCSDSTVCSFAELHPSDVGRGRRRSDNLLAVPQKPRYALRRSTSSHSPVPSSRGDSPVPSEGCFTYSSPISSYPTISVNGQSSPIPSETDSSFLHSPIPSENGGRVRLPLPPTREFRLPLPASSPQESPSGSSPFLREILLGGFDSLALQLSERPTVYED